MNRTWLEIIFPASLALLVCTIGMLLLTMMGVLEVPLTEDAGAVSTSPSPVALADSAASAQGITNPEIAAGDALFKSNCAQCHAADEVVVGPALAGISRRRPEKWVVAWVKNSSKLVASGDEYAVKIFNQYQKQQMPSFQLTDEEIRQILLYIDDNAPVSNTTSTGKTVSLQAVYCQ